MVFTTVSPRATKLLGQREPSFSNMLSSFFRSTVRLLFFIHPFPSLQLKKYFVKSLVLIYSGGKGKGLLVFHEEPRFEDWDSQSPTHPLLFAVLINHASTKVERELTCR